MSRPLKPWLQLPSVTATALDLEARRHPRWADVQNAWGLLLLSRGWTADARKVFETCLELNPDYAWAAVNLAQTLALTGHPDRAATVLHAQTGDTLMTRYAQVFLHLAHGNLSSAREEWKGAPALASRVDGLRLGAALWKGEDDARAEAMWRTAADELPPAQAADFCPWDDEGVRLLSLVPGLHAVWRFASDHLARRGAIEPAERCATAAYAQWSDRGAWLYQRANVAGYAGRELEARRLFAEAAWAAPEDPAPHAALAFRLSADGDLDGAHEALHEALRRGPRFADLHHQLGLVLRARGELEDALASFAAALEINPNFTVCRLDQAMTLLRLERDQPALHALEQVMDAGWRSADLYTQRGRIEERLGRLERAEASFREALRLNPEEAYAHYLLGNLFKKMNKRESAQAAWKRYLNLSRDPARSAEVESLLELH